MDSVRQLLHDYLLLFAMVNAVGNLPLFAGLTEFPILKLASYVEKIVGQNGIMVISRILYIFICAKATSFILDGLQLKLE